MRFALLASTTLAALAATTTLVAAQPSNTAPAPLPAGPAAEAPADTYRHLSPGVALGLSLGITASGYAAFALDDMIDTESDGLAFYGAAAITLGPSAGHWYQEDVITRGLVTRAAGIAAMGVGLANMELFCERDCGDDSLAGALFIGGMVAFTVGSVDDIVSAPINASQRNRKNRARAIESLSFAPQVSHDRVGFALAGSF